MGWLPAPAATRGETGDPVPEVAVRVIRLADRADHFLAGGATPFFGHALAGVATPAFDEGVASKNASFNSCEFAFVQPTFRAAVDFIAVIEHEACTVRVAEKFKIRNFHTITGFSPV